MEATDYLLITTIDQAIERFYDLHVGTVGSSAERHERPHKPILLLMILDLLALNEAAPERISWTNDLRSRFTAYFERVRSSNDSNTPENPFLYLRGDGFWQPFLGCDETTIPLDRTPTVGDAATNQVFARLTNGLENLVCLQTQRVRLREALTSRYFPTKSRDIEPLFVERVANAEKESENGKSVDAGGKSGGRNPAFRRKILEIYDSQCVACGLRIKLPDNWFTFIDGAHLVPYMFSRNDHPTNGIALCKNHHWAMDRFLIAPTPARRWRVSSQLDPRRSTGEKDLCALENQPLLAPHDDAFHPSEDCLKWRADRISTGAQRTLQEVVFE